MQPMSADTDGLASSPSLFQYFLSKLSNEHQREVDELRSQNAELSGRLGLPTAVVPIQPPERPLASPSQPQEAPDQAYKLITPADGEAEDQITPMALGNPGTNRGTLQIARVNKRTSSKGRVSFCPKQVPEPPDIPGMLDVSSNGVIPEEPPPPNVLGMKDTRSNFKRTMSRDFKEAAEEKTKGRLLSQFKLCGASSEVILESYFHAWQKHTKHMRTSIEFTLRPTWEEEEDPAIHSNIVIHRTKSGKEGDFELASSARRTATISHGTMRMGATESEDTVAYAGARAGGWRPSRLIISPNSSRRIFWDLAGALLLFYDIIMIPMMAFDPPRTGFSIAMDWVTLIFWTFDMLASCMTGYFYKGDQVMNPLMILCNYLRGWFLLDVAVVVPDWVFTVLELASSGQSGGSDGAEGGRMLRALRVLRTARLLRLAKLKRLISILKDHIDSEATFIMINVLKMILMLLMVNHFLGSVWYAIGSMSEPNWIDVHSFAAASLADRYSVSLHWSLTQFTPASMSVQPQCVAERVFAISVLVFGLVLFSSIVGSITASMTQLRGMSEEKSKQFWLLRRYLRQRGIDAQLCFRVLRYIEYSLQSQKDLVSEQRIWVLSHLSSQLRDELNFEVSFSCMNNHPLFVRQSCVADDMMSRLSRTALSQQSLAPGDLLFSAGTQATHMHMMVTGVLHYVKAQDFLAEEEPNEVCAGDWACEVALWTAWTCVGTCRAVQECRLVQIEAISYGEAVKKDAAVWSLVARYARNYLKWLNARQRGALTDAAKKDAMLTLMDSFLEDDDCSDEEEDLNIDRISSGLLPTHNYHNLLPNVTGVVKRSSRLVTSFVGGGPGGRNSVRPRKWGSGNSDQPGRRKQGSTSSSQQAKSPPIRSFSSDSSIRDAAQDEQCR